MLDARDHGFYEVDVPNFWERPEMAGMIRDVRIKPDKYAWLERRALPPPLRDKFEDGDADIQEILDALRE